MDVITRDVVAFFVVVDVQVRSVLPFATNLVLVTILSNIACSVTNFHRFHVTLSIEMHLLGDKLSGIASA